MRLYPIAQQVNESMTMSAIMRQQFNTTQFKSAGIICDSNCSLQYVDKDKNGCGNVVFINNKYYCMTSAHVLPKEWRIGSSTTHIKKMFILNNKKYELLPPKPENMVYNDLYDIALIEIKTNGPLPTSTLTLIEQPINGWKINHSSKGTYGATPLSNTNHQKLRPAYMERISTQKPGSSGAGLIGSTGAIFGIHRQANTGSLPIHYPPNTCFVGIEKEGCSLKGVWEHLAYQGNTKSDLYKLLNETAKKEGLVGQSQEYLNSIRNQIENDPSRYQARKKQRISKEMFTEEGKGLKGLPFNIVEKYMTKHELLKHYCRKSFQKHAKEADWGPSKKLTVFRLNNEQALKDCVKRNGNGKRLLVTKAIDYRWNGREIEEVCSTNKFVLVDVNNHKIVHTHGSTN